MGIDGNLTRKQFLGALTAAMVTPKLALAETSASPSTQVGNSELEIADRINGLKLSDTQHRLALAGVKTNTANFQGIRDLKLPNDLEPNLVFVPKGREPNRKAKSIVKISGDSTRNRGSNEDIAFQSVSALALLIKTKQISPVELTKIYLERLNRFGDDLKCVVTLTDELAMAQAKRAEDEIMKGRYRGHLHGIPYGIKDLFSVKGYRTTWGAEAFKEQKFDYDAAVVEKLSEAGAVCLAKLSCGALAYDDVWWGGQTKNPWNPKEGSSGSSAGSACSTAAGLVGFSIGTETLGSIISPANRCRVSGLRPTYGRVSRFGGMVLTWTMDKVGPICRTIQDCAIVLSQIRGADPRDLASVDRPFVYQSKPDLKKLKIGVLTAPKENPIETADWAKELIAQGANLSPVQFSSPPEGIWALLVAEAAAFFDELTRTHGIEQIGNLWPKEFLAARYLPAVEYINAHRARALMASKFEAEFGDFDVIVTDHFWDEAFTICNGTGHPQAIIPWGLDKGEPKSVSVIGRLYSEGLASGVANIIQKSQNFHRLRPNLDSIS